MEFLRESAAGKSMNEISRMILAMGAEMRAAGINFRLSNRLGWVGNDPVQVFCGEGPNVLNVMVINQRGQIYRFSQNSGRITLVDPANPATSPWNINLDGLIPEIN